MTKNEKNNEIFRSKLNEELDVKMKAMKKKSTQL